MAVTNINIARAEKENDNTCVTPADALEAASVHMRENPELYNQAFVILVNTKDGAYDSGFRMANMSCSEAIAAIEIIKVGLLEQMGY